MNLKKKITLSPQSDKILKLLYNIQVNILIGYLGTTTQGITRKFIEVQIRSRFPYSTQ